MSKGMKQKVGIVLAFMHDPSVYILDEPTSGLDPLMQKIFVELIEEEKQRGKTILMSSHMFQEIEKTCDRVGLVKDGRMVTVSAVSEIRKQQRKVFVVTLGSAREAEQLIDTGLNITGRDGERVEVTIRGDYQLFFQTLAAIDVRNLDLHTQNLEDLFMHYYDKEGER
jgi:ABC-2 type transport system ATP-binding protein